MSDMEFTGERFVTNYDSPQINYEHWHRYLYAAHFVEGKEVLDIASGEGYGSHLLAQTAKQVTGVDISEEAVDYAKQAYPKKNLRFLLGSVAAIPIEGEQVFDVIVSFETIEHVDQSSQQAFLKEIKRLLKADGLLIISTPNKLIYSDLPKYKNEFHIKEFYFREFKEFLQTQFQHVKMLGQRIYSGSFIWPLDKHSKNESLDFQLNFEKSIKPVDQPKSDLYDIAICSEQALSDLVPSTAVDLSDRLIKSKDRVIAELTGMLQQKENIIKQLLTRVNQLKESSPGSDQQHRTKVSIVIPVYNKVEYTKQCLEALIAHTPGELFELIIVDNASTDQTKELLSVLEGDVKIIYNQENCGFVGACNQGAEEAAGEYLLFLNNDTIPLAGWLEALVKLADSDSTIGAVGAKLIYPQGKLQEAGGIIFKDGSGWNFGRLDDPEKTIYNESCHVDYCSGAALLVRSELFNELGGFDKRFAPAYYEDVDLCFGIRSLGYHVMYCAQAAVVHCEGITAGTDLAAGFKQYQIVNRQKFIDKWKTELQQHEDSPTVSKQLPITADRVKRGLEESVAALKEKQTSDVLKVLVIDPILPRYDRAAGSLRLYNILKILLSIGCKVTYIARNGVRQEQYKRDLESMGITVYATDPDKMAALGCKLDAERIDLPKILEENQFHLAWLSFYDVAEQYLPEIRKYSPETTIMVDTVDVHFLREMRQAKLYQDEQLAAKAQVTKERELKIYDQADWLMTVTQQDKELLQEYLFDKEIIILPTIHTEQPQGPSFEQRQGLLFVGNFHHPPNADAMSYFCKQVLPLINKKMPEIKLTIIGDNPPEEVKAFAGDLVKVTGYVMETEPYIKSHRIAIAPLRFGAGIKGKIGEALSHGLPVVTTTIGAEGMKLVDGQHVLIADDPATFADQVLNLYTDPTLWNAMARQGKEHIEKNYGLTAITEIIRDIKQRLLNKDDQSQELISIIMLTHNQLEYTRQCINSIFEHTHYQFELVVVDNHSSDGTLDYIDQLIKERSHSGYCQKIQLISNSSNLGFSKGNNQGLAQAHGDYMLLLNNDTVVTDKWLEPMLDILKTKPQAGIAGPMSNYVSGPQLVQTVGYDVKNLLGLNEYAAGFKQKRKNQARPYWRVVGFCMLIKKSVIDKIGGFDGRYGYGNFEDDDFSLRAALAGYESWIAEDSFVHHFGSQTFKAAQIDYQSSLKTNWELFKQKWNIPSELQYGEPYEMTTLVQQKFRAEHYCPLPEVAVTANR